MAHGAFIVVRAAVYAAIELIAAGAFQQEVSAKETLQELVVDRTAQISQQKEQIVKQKDELKIAGLALHASETALAVTNGKREIVWYNPAMQRLTSSNDEVSLLHRRFEDVLTSSNADAIEFVSCFKESGLADVEIVYDKKIIQAQVSPSTAANTGEADEQRFVVVLKDITESRALEKAIKLAEDETIRSIAMNEAMETLTHELRTPLQGIMGMTSLILDNDDGSLKSDTKESLSLVMVSSRLLLTLINNILDVRKCDASMLDNLELNAVPAKGPLTDAVDFCRPLSSIHGVEVEMTYDDSPTNGSAEHAVVLSDSVRVQQIGINLVSNAIKYAPKDSTISIHSRIMALLHVEEIVDASLASGNHPLPLNNTNTVPKDMQKVLVVSVSDQGQGIDESKKSFLFKKFAQLKESKHRKNAAQVGQPSGTGLGLNLCDKFVNRMNGRIWANNNMNEDGSRGTGACFSFYLPLCESHRAETLPTMDANGVPPTAINLLAPAIFPDHKGLLTPFCPCVSQLRLLLVDDTALNLKILDKMLKRCDLDEVVLACSGGEALDVLSKQEFDLVITDIHMPNGMSGNALSEAIRDGQLKRKPAVIGLTADVSQDLHRRCTDSGMAFVIHKPITVEKLRQLFESLLATGT